MIAQNARIFGNVNISFVQKYRYFYSGLAVKNDDGKFSQIQIILFCETRDTVCYEEAVEVGDFVSRFYAYLNIKGLF